MTKPRNTRRKNKIGNAGDSSRAKAKDSKDTSSKKTRRKNAENANQERPNRWPGEDGLVVVDLEGGQENKAAIVYSAAAGMLPSKKIGLLKGVWNSDDEWSWDRSAGVSDSNLEDSFDLLRDLVWQVFRKGNYKGSLVVVVPDRVRNYLYDWFFDPWFDLAARGQSALLGSTSICESWLYDSKISSTNLINLVVHLWFQVSRSGRAVIICAPPNSDRFSVVNQPFFSPNYLCGLIEHFDERDEASIFSYVRTLLNRVAYRVSPTVSEKPQGKILSSEQHATTGWQDYSMLPKSAEYEDFLRQEIGSRELAGLFIKLCSEAFDRHPEPTRSKFTVLPSEIQVALGALRIARRLANWTLEGDSFRCSIVLFSESEHDELSGFYPIIEIDPDVPFTFPFIEEIRTHAEAAQGEGLFLLVNATTGKLTKIARHVDNESGDRDRRHEFFGYLVSRSGLIIHLRDQGFVEVYTQGKLALWNDGFEWTSYPYQKLEDALDEHLTKPRTAKEPDSSRSLQNQSKSSGRQVIPHLFKAQLSLTDAIRRLLDRRASSLIVLLHEDDHLAFEELAYEQLRQNIFLAGKKKTKVFVDKLDPEALAGLLAVDGAHVIDQSGRLIHLARRINATSARYSVKITASRDQILDLRKQIHKSQRFEEFVVWKSDVDKETYFDIYGFVDRRKWTQSIRPFLEDLENTTGVTITNPARSKICEGLSLALLLDFEVDESDTSGLAVLDGRMSELSEILVSKFESIRQSTQLVNDMTLSTNRNSFCRIRDPEDSNRWGYLFPLFFNKYPAKASQFVSQEIDFESSLKSLCTDEVLEKLKVKLKLTTCFAMEVEESLPNTGDFWGSPNLGVGLQSVSSDDEPKTRHYWFALDNSIKLAAESRENKLRPSVQRKFRAFVRGDSSETHAGTGTRAARELTRRLTKSRVVKVSASGNLKISKPS